MLKTNQVMLRQMDGVKISQRTKDSFFNATEMLHHFNNLTGQNKRFKDFWDNLNTKAFCEALKQEIYNGDNSAHLEIVETSRGKGGSTWMHPYLFVKFCFWLSPVFEVKVIKWVYDNLIDFRHEAGDHYKEMCKAIAETYHSWYGKSPDPLIYVKEAKYLNILVFGKPDSNKRNEATEKQLSIMNKLQKLNTSLILDITDKNVRYKKLKDFAEMLTISE
jgi:hypothetical protein